ncbi:MAG: class I SAM-dependent methyltransferase, partial [Nitrospirae bacterium]
HRFSGAPGPEVCFRLTDPSLPRRIFFNTELAVGEGYMEGTFVLEGCDLRDFFRFYALNQEALWRYPTQSAFSRLSRLFRWAQQYNPVGKAQEHVSHHYDISNDLYRLFLDRDLQYSCAYFRRPDESLEEAQQNKKRRIAAKLLLAPGQRVLDIGCGWGGLAIYLAQVAEVEVLGVTLAREQYRLACERAEAAGVADRVRFELKDYRLVEGRFDRIVSVGMFEHVGVPGYHQFFAKVRELLAEDGVALLHSIGHMSPPSTASAWLRKYIFPGAYSPALSEVFPHTERNRLWVTDLEVWRTHYAETLRHWYERFAAHREEVIARWDERFYRMWEFYLVSCENMFRTGAQMVFQMQLAHRRDAAPLTRDYVAEAEARLAEREAELAAAPEAAPAP